LDRGWGEARAFLDTEVTNRKKNSFPPGNRTPVVQPVAVVDTVNENSKFVYKGLQKLNFRQCGDFICFTYFSQFKCLSTIYYKLKGDRDIIIIIIIIIIVVVVVVLVLVVVVIIIIIIRKDVALNCSQFGPYFTP
jgi:hypothetical protein